MGGWDTALPAPRRKMWVRLFCTDSEGKQVGRDFGRAFDCLELLIFECQPQLRSAMLLEAQEELTDYDRARLAELLQATSSPQAPAAAKIAPPASFLQRLRPAFKSLLISLFPDTF